MEQGTELFILLLLQVTSGGWIDREEERHRDRDKERKRHRFWKMKLLHA